MKNLIVIFVSILSSTSIFAEQQETRFRAPAVHKDSIFFTRGCTEIHYPWASFFTVASYKKRILFVDGKQVSVSYSPRWMATIMVWFFLVSFFCSGFLMMLIGWHEWNSLFWAGVFCTLLSLGVTLYICLTFKVLVLPVIIMVAGWWALNRNGGVINSE